MAATAYAALVSLMTTITMEQTPSPLHPPFPFPQQFIQALLQRVRLLVGFLEQGWKGAEHLEPRITRLAYAAEDAIEIPIVDQIRSTSASTSSSVPLGQDLESIIQELDSIKMEMMLLIKDKSTAMIKDVNPGSSISTTSSTAPPQWVKTKMVGFQEEKSEIIHQLTWQERSLRLIPIVGMGGIGKTTLARNVCDNELIMKHFDVLVWVTVSQEYNVRDILMGVLSSSQNQRNVEINGETLGDQVYKSLFDRRYLVILDDMWSIDVWDEIKWCFPDNINGSRIMVTTRLTSLAEELSTFGLGMKCLDEENSWNLFCEKAFAQRSCPLELETVGKKIARNCKGLPLAISVIGGLLTKSNNTLEYWEHVAEDFSSYLYSSDMDHCSKILVLSYNHLPIHLKPCLLYLGVFPEDHEIQVSRLMELWIAEGFLKPKEGKIWDEIGEEYLKELIERNLIMVSRCGWTGKIKYCVIHDLLREVCLREAEKEMFYCVVTEKCLDIPVAMGYQRRIVIRPYKLKMKQSSLIIDSLGSESHVRSLILPRLDVMENHKFFLQYPAFKLLRILFTIDKFNSRRPDFDSVNIRCFSSEFNLRSLLPRISNFRNFQVLDWEYHRKSFEEPIKAQIEAPFAFWNLVQLHRVKFNGFFLPLPPDCREDVVLENLQSLSTLVDFRFSEEVIKRMPNVKKLKAVYQRETCEDWSCCYSIHYVDRLKKLESFSYTLYGRTPNRDEFLRNLAFPPSLKKLYLSGCKLLWEDMSVVGSLPHLEVLKLGHHSFVGSEWTPVMEQFRRLKFLHLELIDDLINWNADNTHFPSLQELSLYKCWKLKEIPSAIGDISTLQLIKLTQCSVSTMMSVKNILEEQQSFGNDELAVEIYSWKMYSSLHDSEIKNFVAKSYRNVYGVSDDEDLHGIFLHHGSSSSRRRR